MRQTLKPGVALAGALLALAAAGCGGSSGSDESQVRDAIKAVIHARNHNDFAAVCAGLAAEQAAEIRKTSGLSCAEALQSVPGATNTRTKLQIQQIRISGERATVEATVHHNGGDGQDQSILM